MRLRLSEGALDTNPAFYTLVLITLLASFFLSAFVSNVAEPLSGPDERHHYSRIQYAARNPTEFPPRLEQIRSNRGDFNHLSHPPLYYVTMALAYRLSRIDAQVTEAGVELDVGGSISASAGVRALRPWALAFAATHLFGIYLFVMALLQAGILSRLGSYLIIAVSALMPSTTYISGVLNNDHLALSLYPFLLLSLFRLVHDGAPNALAAIAFISGALVLTKATMWPLVLAVCVVSVVQVAPTKRFGSWRREPKWPDTETEWPLSRAAFHVVGAFSVLIATYYLVSTLLRYGALQPGYVAVYGLSGAEAETRFFVGPPEAPMSRIELAIERLSRVARSSIGILSQTRGGRTNNAWPQLLVLIFALGSMLSLAATPWVRKSLASGRTANRQEVRGTGLFLMYLLFAVSPVLYAVYFALRGYEGYLASGYFTGQGRYFIGYTTLWASAVAIALTALGKSRRCGTSLDGRFVRVRSVSGVLVAALVVVGLQPLVFIRESSELGRQMGIEQRLTDGWTEAGFMAAPLEAVSPDRFRDSGRLAMAWRNSQVEAALVIPAPSCLYLKVMLRGDTQRREASRMIVHVRSRGGETISVQTFDAPSGLVAVGLSVVEVVEGPATLSIRQENPSVDWSRRERLISMIGLPHRSRVRVPEILAVYWRTLDC